MVEKVLSNDIEFIKTGIRLVTKIIKGFDGE